MGSNLEDELKQVVQSNKEILQLLDKIEEQQKQQKERKIDNKEKSTDEEKKHEIHVKKTERQTDGSNNNSEPRILIEPKQRNSNLGNLVFIQNKSGRIETGPGFNEKITLTEKQKQFGKVLKARKTLIEQDNRICEQFGLPSINKGHVYEPSRNPKVHENPKSVAKDRDADVKKTKQKDGFSELKTRTGNSAKQADQKQPPKSILKKRPVSNPKTPVVASNPKSILKKPETSRRHVNERAVVVREPRTVAKPENSASTKDLERSNDVQQGLLRLVQAHDVNTDQGKQLIKAQAHLMRTQLVDLMPDKRLAFHTWADMLEKMAGANGKLEDPNFWQRMSDDISEEQREALLQHVGEMESIMLGGVHVQLGENISEEQREALLQHVGEMESIMFGGVHVQLDENVKGFFKGSLSLMKAVAEGKYMEKCMAIGGYIEEHPEQFMDQSSIQINVMRAFGEMADSDRGHRRNAIEGRRSERLAIRDSQADEQQTRIVVPRRIEKVEEKPAKVEERVTINEGLWAEYANEEVKKAKIAKDIREKGMDTIFCLDVSQSMKGEPLRQAKTFIKGFVEGIQNTNLGNDVFEHVSLVTFGSETKVQQHLTCDYFELLRKLDRLQPGGPTPMFAGLTMTWAAILGAGTVFSSNGYKIYPRVYLLSDGKMTPASFIAGEDSCTEDETKIEHEKVTKHAIHLHKQYHLTIHAVPVGEFDMNTLESLTKETGGKIIGPEDWKSECKTFRNYLKACSFGQSKELHQLMVDVLHVDPDDQAQIDEFLKTHKREGGGDGEDFSPGYENAVFPTLGSRVRKKQSILCGTVTKHFKDGIGVTWDRPSTEGSLREKIDDIDDIEQVKELRVLKDELIALGCRVKRGKDWSYGDQDGKPGNEGSVFMVQEEGRVAVRWDYDGSKAFYNYGLNGRFDLEIIQPTASSHQSTPNIIEKRKEINIDELNRRNKQNSEEESNKEYKWAWQEKNGSWRTYTESVSKTIEASYKRNPRGTVLITIEDKQYRYSLEWNKRMSTLWKGFLCQYHSIGPYLPTIINSLQYDKILG